MTMGAVMNAMPNDTQDSYYSPQRLRFLLGLYPVLGYSKPPADPDMRAKVKAVFGDATWTEASAKAADLERAIFWLQEREPRAAYAVRASYIVGLSLRDIQGYYRRVGIAVSHETVNRWRKDGLELMSAYLCGRV